MRARGALLSILAASLATAAAVPARAQAKKQPVYVGARACAACHEGRHAGNQYSHWLMSRHAQAWAELARPEAKEMARLVGARVGCPAGEVVVASTGVIGQPLPMAKIRRGIAEVVGRIDDPRAVPILVTTASDPDVDVATRQSSPSVCGMLPMLASWSSRRSTTPIPKCDEARRARASRTVHHEPRWRAWSSSR